MVTDRKTSAGEYSDNTNEVSKKPSVESDNELLLAKQLLNSGKADQNDLPESMVAQLSQEELEHFVQAREGLDFLNQASPGNSAKKNANAATRSQDSLDTWDDWNRLGDDQVPLRIGRFVIHEEIGRGGFGIVLRATDPRLDRDIALKVPRTNSLLRTDLLKRFQREARAAALLAHPGIVPIFESDRVGPILYIAYEYVQGETLSQWIREEGTIEPKLAARLMLPLAEAVQYAHSRGLVHRDLKPANVLIDSRSNIGDQENAEPANSVQMDFEQSVPRLRITDFGLADLQGDDENLTNEDALVGTPSYMSPEQAAGKPATSSSDLYSLGVILYEMLTGKVPFRSESHLETLRKIVDESPLSPRRYQATIPKDLAAICLKCLEKAPSERYETVQGFADDLQRFISGVPVRARYLTWLGRTTRWCKTNPLLTTALAAVFISMGAGTTISVWQWQRAEHNLVQSQSNEIRAERSLRQAEQAIEQMLGRVSESLKNIPATSVLRRDLLYDALQLQIQLTEINENGKPSLQMVRAFRRLGMIQNDLGLLDPSQQSYEAALDVLNQLDQTEIETKQEQSAVQRRLAAVFLRRGNTEKCLEYCQQSISVLDEVQDDLLSLSLLIDAHMVLGRAKDSLGQPITAAEAFEAGLELTNTLDTLLGTDEAGRESLPIGFNLASKKASLLNSLAIELKRQGKTEESKNKYLESISQTQLALDTNPERVDLLEQLGGTSINLGNLETAARKFQEARAHYQMAVDTFQTLATRFPAVPLYRMRLLASQNGLGIAQHRLGNTELAEETFVESVEFLNRPRDVEPGPAEVDAESRLLSSYGNLLSELNRNEDAIKQFDHSLKLQLELLKISPRSPSKQFQAGLVAGNRAIVFLKLSDYEKAAEGFAIATMHARSAFHLLPESTRYRSSLAWNLDKLVWAHCGAGDHRESIDVATELFDLYPNDERRAISLLRRLKSCLALIDEDRPKSDGSLEREHSGPVNRYERKMVTITQRMSELDAAFHKRLTKTDPSLADLLKSLKAKLDQNW